jgi:hypothetical protein
MSATVTFLSGDTGRMYATSTDPATPTAEVVGGRAVCPEEGCDARVPLREMLPGTGILTAIEYQEHFWNEHTKPALRYEETSQ